MSFSEVYINYLNILRFYPKIILFMYINIKRRIQSILKEVMFNEVSNHRILFSEIKTRPLMFNRPWKITRPETSRLNKTRMSTQIPVDWPVDSRPTRCYWSQCRPCQSSDRWTDDLGTQRLRGSPIGSDKCTTDPSQGFPSPRKWTLICDSGGCRIICLFSFPVESKFPTLFIWRVGLLSSTLQCNVSRIHVPSTSLRLEYD